MAFLPFTPRAGFKEVRAKIRTMLEELYSLVGVGGDSCCVVDFDENIPNPGTATWDFDEGDSTAIGVITGYFADLDEGAST